MPKMVNNQQFRVTFRQVGAGGAYRSTTVVAPDETVALQKGTADCHVEQWCDEVGTSVLIECVGDL